MATVVVYGGTSDGDAAQRVVRNLVQSYFDVKHMLDHLVALRNSGAGSNWAAIEAATGAPAGTGQTFFNTWDTFNASMLTAYNACATLDQMRPV
jgi:hypothetical protein